MNSNIKFGVIGLGHIGYRHVQSIIENPKTDLIAISDKIPLEEILINKNKNIRNLDTIKFHNNFRDLLKISEIDVVNICTPNWLHYEMAFEAISNGKHVLIEKPMTLSSKKANHLVDYAKKNKRFVFCVMQNRFSPTIMWLKKIIEQKKLGRIFSIHVNCFWNRNEKYYTLSDWHGKLELDGGPLYTQFSHFIDILYWLFGEIKNIVKAEFINFRKSKLIDFEDSGFLNFDFSGGAKGTLNYSTSIWQKNFESSIIVNAEKGTIKIGGQYMDKLDYCHIENYEKPIINNSDLKCNDYGTYKGSAANHDRVIENIVNVILNNHEIATSGSEGAKIVEIIEKIYSFRN